MVDAGVVVDDNCLEQFKAFHQKSSNVRLITFAINDKCDRVEVTKQVEKGGDCETWESMCNNLLGTEYAERPCWIIYNLEFTKEDQGIERQISKLVFLHWVPTKSKLKLKMLMSSTKQTLFTKLGCSMVNIEGTHLSDIAEKSILDKLSVL